MRGSSIYRFLPMLLGACLALGVGGAKASAQNVQILEHTPATDHPTVGPEDAPVTLEFFLNLGDAQSVRSIPMVQKLISRHPKRLRVIYRLTEKSKRSSSLAQNFGRGAFVQGRFFEFLEAYLAGRKPYPRTKAYPGIAAAAGVNYARVQKALESMEHELAFLEAHHYYKRVEIKQVPGFRFNGRNAIRDRTRTLEKLEELYDEAYAEAMRLRASGVAQSDVSDRTSASWDAERYGRRKFRGPLDGDIADPPTGPSAVPMAKLAAGSLVQGPDDAKVTLVFVCHFQSFHCGRMSGYLDEIRKAYPAEVRVVFRPLYDPEQPGQDKAPLMHQAALCADEQNAFWEFYRHAFQQQRRINFDQSLAVELAASEALDLDVPRFEECLESGRYLESLDQERTLVRAAGIQHTPALVVGGVAYWGRLHFTDIRLLVNNALRPGLLEHLGSP